jgi:Raf kinase inhibitor-like YbhB/YbcL family protein
MKISSSAFKEGEMIPSKYTADGKDISPPLSWSEIPAEAKSLALICDDPDAPVGLWVHWLVADIPTTVTEVAENSVPKGGRLVTNDFHQPEYGGPAPPSGIHRYFFKLYALLIPKMENVKDKKAFYQTVEKYKIAEASLMGKYQRQKR